MLYLPPLRRLLLPSLLCLAFILYYKSTARIPTTREQLQNLIIRQPTLSPVGERVPVRHLDYSQIIFADPSENHRSPPVSYYYNYKDPDKELEDATGHKFSYSKPETHPHLAPLFQCPAKPNPVTNHIRLPNPLYNISLVVRNETEHERKGYLNPAIISLPFWSQNQYILVSRVNTDGSHMQNLLCEANICYVGSEKNARHEEKPCTEKDLELLGGNMGMRCATPPMILNVPPTPAEDCGRKAGILMDIPGFHDPRVFWSGKGEPIMMVNSQSRYACFGLWVIDLRKLHEPFEKLLAHHPFVPSFGPLMSYPSLTELTRNPKNTRGAIEKNWMMFGSQYDNYLHYDISPTKRTFAKLLGGGLTTVNLTDSRELPCLDDGPDPEVKGSWHQGTNSLRVILCEREDKECTPNPQNEVFVSVIHRKIKAAFSLPLRYERYFIVWAAQPPFSMLGISKHPILLYNETANGFDSEDNWHEDPEQEELLARGKRGKDNWAYFTYTVSIAWSWGRPMDEPSQKNTGYLNDEIVLGVGVDDAAMVFGRVVARDLLQCLRACPGRAPAPLYVSPSKEVSSKSEGIDKYLTSTKDEKEKEATESTEEQTEESASAEEAEITIEVSEEVEEPSASAEAASAETGAAEKESG